MYDSFKYNLSLQIDRKIMTPEKILELLPKIGCDAFDCTSLELCEKCDGGKLDCHWFTQLKAFKQCANALAGKVVAKEDLLKFLKDGKDRCGCVNHCGCNEQDRLELFLEKANRGKV